MNTIKLNSNSVSTTTVVPNIFIDIYMPQANGTYVKVYLYLLRCINSTSDMYFSISTIADVLDETEKDIIRALGYWEKVNLISLTKSADDEITSITINDMMDTTLTREASAAHTSNATSNPISAESFDEIASTEAIVAPDAILNAMDKSSKEDISSKGDTPMTKGNVGFEKPTYSEAQIAQLTENDEVKWLLNIIEIYIDRLIKPMDVQLILYLYESLGFSTELIMYLYEYCVSKNKKNPSYVEAVALAWHEEGIDTVEKAEQATVSYNTNYNAVNKAFGLNRSPGEVEKQFIHKWLNKYQLNIDIIVEACNRTILATQKPDFKYADRILENWSKRGVKELSHIKQLDEEHKKQSQKSNMQKNNAVNQTATASPNNRFNAFQQRNYTKEDYSSLEQRLLERNKTLNQ